MGVSPPRGSLGGPPSLLDPHSGGGWDWTEVSLSLTESLPIQLAIGCFADGWNRSAPYLAVVDRCRSAWLSEPNRNVWVSSFATLRCASTGGLGASSGVARPFSKGPVRKVFRWLGIRFSRNPRGGDNSTPSLLSRVREGVENQKIILFSSKSGVYSKFYGGAYSPPSARY